MDIKITKKERAVHSSITSSWPIKPDENNWRPDELQRLFLLKYETKKSIIFIKFHDQILIKFMILTEYMFIDLLDENADLLNSYAVKFT